MTEAPIIEQIKECHPNELASALIRHGIVKPRGLYDKGIYAPAAAMVANNRPHCEQLILNAIQSK